MRRHSWLLWVLAGVIIPTAIILAPLHQWVQASTPEPVAVRTATPADDRTAAIRRNMEAQIAHLDEMIAYQRALLADVESIADLVPPEYRLLCVQAARSRDLEPRTLAAVGWTESRWNPRALGAAGEIGIMQIMPDTGAWLAQRIGLRDYDLWDPATNINLAASYLLLLTQEHGSVDEALAAYNAGPQWRTRAPQAARGYVDRVRQAAAGQ